MEKLLNGLGCISALKALGDETRLRILRLLLLDSLAPGTVAWGHEVADVHPEADGRWLLDIKDKLPVIADFVVGADGIGSKVRRRLTSVQPVYTGVNMIEWRRGRWEIVHINLCEHLPVELRTV